MLHYRRNVRRSLGGERREVLGRATVKPNRDQHHRCRGRAQRHSESDFSGALRDDLMQQHKHGDRGKKEPRGGEAAEQERVEAAFAGLLAQLVDDCVDWEPRYAFINGGFLFEGYSRGSQEGRRRTITSIMSSVC